MASKLDKIIDEILKIACKVIVIVKVTLFGLIAIFLSPIWLPIYTGGWVYEFFDKSIKSWWIKIFISVASTCIVFYIFYYIFPDWSSGVMSIFGGDGEENCLEPRVC